MDAKYLGRKSLAHQDKLCIEVGVFLSGKNAFKVAIKRVFFSFPLAPVGNDLLFSLLSNRELCARRPLSMKYDRQLR